MSTQTAFKTRPEAQTELSTARKVYTVEVSLLSGPMTEQFAEENPEVKRTIQIRGDQTLEGLHDAIFTAFDREDDNMYEFRLGEGPHDPEGRYYVLPSELSRRTTARKTIAGDVTKTRIESLELMPSETFTYWFDFADDWMHRITVLSVGDALPNGKYPRTIGRIGESPSQYPELQDEDGDEEYLEEEEWPVLY